MTAVSRSAQQARCNMVGSYMISEVAGLFLAFSAAGWLWEVGLHLLLDGELVNRGTMLGPWLPIYGVGGLLPVLLLMRFAAQPVLVFALGVLLSTAIEFAAGEYLLAVYGLRWWDYSSFPLNVDGLISLPTALVFGLGCCAAVYLAAPRLQAVFRRMPHEVFGLLCVLLIALFALDFCASTLHPNTGQGVAIRASEQNNLQVIEPARIEMLLYHLAK